MRVANTALWDSGQSGLVEVEAEYGTLLDACNVGLRDNAEVVVILLITGVWDR